MQTASNRIWTRVVQSISYDDNHYAMSAPIFAIEKKQKNKNGVVANVLNCDIVVSEFEFQAWLLCSRSDLSPLGKVWTLSPPPAMG